MPDSRRILRSPRTTLLPKLSPVQVISLGYPPDALPGSRDIKTPFGSMRIYEWGPVDGKKVIMIHGDATPSPMFRPIAQELISSGCRLMTFDLWGRGYTDTPSNDPHDSTLYMQQILYALVTSPIQWTGKDVRFSLIGFSMGGAIALDFFGHHPALIDSIVLLGPAGLIRNLPPEYSSVYIDHSQIVPTSKIRTLIGTLLGVKLDNKSTDELPEEEEVLNPEGFSPAGALQFQFDHHEGHVQSFLSTIQHGPLQHRDDIWKAACEIITGDIIQDTPLCNGKILVICGQDDAVVPANDVKSDLQRYLGEEEGKHWEMHTVPGGHGFPWPEGPTIGKIINEFWGLK